MVKKTQFEKDLELLNDFECGQCGKKVKSHRIWELKKCLVIFQMKTEKTFDSMCIDMDEVHWLANETRRIRRDRTNMKRKLR